MDAAALMRVTHILSSLFAAMALIAVLGTPVAAQPEGPNPRDVEEQRKAPQPPVTLGDLFERLKTAEDATEAKGIATLIGRRLARSGSATVDLLSDRAREAMTQDDVPLAVELMDRATLLEPNWAEGWNRRATLFFRLQDPASAVADLERALVAEPRHFEAWAGLGKVYLETDDKRRAFDAFRRAQALYPQWDVVKQAIDKLKPEVEGRDL